MMASSVERLLQFDRIYAHHHQAIVDWLGISEGVQVLDAGCGAGGTTRMLAAAVGAQGHVAALDVKPEHLDAAREAVAGLPGRVTFHECSLLEMSFAGAEFDLVWCSRVVHHLPDQLAATRALVRVTKPGGRVVLREGGVSARCLPFDLGIGEPGLEARLQVVQDRWFSGHVRHESPAHVPYSAGWAQLLRDAGCVAVSAKSFLFEALPPFEDDLMRYAVELLTTRLTDAEVVSHVTSEDNRTIEALIDPAGPHFIGRRNDLHWLAVSSVYVGRVPD
jgi:SAM-dependent methyltransferase